MTITFDLIVGSCLKFLHEFVVPIVATKSLRKSLNIKNLAEAPSFDNFEIFLIILEIGRPV